MKRKNKREIAITSGITNPGKCKTLNLIKSALKEVKTVEDPIKFPSGDKKNS